MSEMLQNHPTPPSTAEDRLPQASHTEPLKTLPPQQALEIRPKPVPTPKYKALPPRADWVNTMFADISGQLRRHSVISSDLFDGLLLKRKTATGSLIMRELRSKYDQLGKDRNLATVRVLVPETVMSGQWQLLWTTKRERDPYGRQFHSQTAIDPINHQAHLEIDTNAGLIFPGGATFSLPPFIQDYGPGPADFDPEPGDEFDAVVSSGIMMDVDEGIWEV